MNKRGEAGAVVMIVVALLLWWLADWHKLNMIRYDQIERARLYCQAEAARLPIVWNEERGQCLLIEEKRPIVARGR